jgi:hypothetical protein
MPGGGDYSRFKWSFKAASNQLQRKNRAFSVCLLTWQKNPRTKRNPPRDSFLVFMENCAMSKRSKLKILFWGLKIDAEGIFAICVTLLIVLAVLAASRF